MVCVAVSTLALCPAAPRPDTHALGLRLVMVAGKGSEPDHVRVSLRPEAQLEASLLAVAHGLMPCVLLHVGFVPISVI